MKLVYELIVHRLLYVLDYGEETGTCGWVDIIKDGLVVHTEQFSGKIGNANLRAERPYSRKIVVDMGNGGSRMEIRFRNTPDSIFECDVAIQAEVP